MKKQFYISPVLLMAGLFMTLFGHAQDGSRTLTLGDAIQLGLTNSKPLQLGRAKIEESVAASREAREARLPDVSVSGSYLRLTQADVTMKAGGDSSSTGPSINQALYGMASVSLPVYAGGRIKYGIASAKFLEKAAELDVENDRQAVILNITAAYINLYKAGASVTIVRDNMKQSRQRDLDFSNLEKNGLLARNDLLKAQLETSNYELALVEAESQEALTRVNMNILLGLPQNTLLQVDSASIQAPGSIQPLENYLQLASTNRTDIKALESRRQASAMGIKAARAEYLPSLALTGGYVAADIPKLLTITNAFNIGVGVSYQLSSLWKTGAKIQQAQARESQIRVNESILNDQVSLAVNKAYQDYISGVKRIDVLNKAVEQAAENFRISQNKYRNSLLTLTDLLDADVAQLRATLNLTLAKADLVLSYQTLLQAAGNL